MGFNAALKKKQSEKFTEKLEGDKLVSFRIPIQHHYELHELAKEMNSYSNPVNVSTLLRMAVEEYINKRIS